MKEKVIPVNGTIGPDRSKDPRSKPQPIRELLRPAVIRTRVASFGLLAQLPWRARYETVHVLGCGRSGTTIIGNAIGLDDDILYPN